MMARAKVERPTAIRDLADFNESINLLIYGDSGVGKTVLCGGAPNAIFLSTETGTISAKRQGSKAKVWRMKNWADLEEAYIWLRDNPDHGFEWVILDSVTKMQQQLVRHTLEQRVLKRSDSDEDVPEIADYQKFQNKFRRFVTQFIEMPTNVIFTATAMRREDEEGDDLVLPSIEGKGYAIANFACAEMDAVLYYGLRAGKGNTPPTRRLLCQPAPPYFAKDRFDSLGRWIDNPTMPEIIKLIESSSSKPPAETPIDDDEDIDFDGE